MHVSRSTNAIAQPRIAYQYRPKKGAGILLQSQVQVVRRRNENRVDRAFRQKKNNRKFLKADMLIGTKSAMDGTPLGPPDKNQL
ncbi:unnamed protein product [Dovyalis caffra]|uniref:Uncharacterized protein n=1 Tax=Dovyalis caffra TaxID=77055 RepID=A0AAV1RDQ7_9ROSI|nr:unnamed protein product [Dovyalis caffra]